MAEHRVRKDNIIYIIPTDELFIKWKNDEAFIDEYGRLMNRKPHRVLKELKPYAAESEVQESYASPIKDLVRDKMVEYSKYAIDRAGDVFFYEVIPNVWHKHIVPLWNGAKDVLFSKELKIDQIKCETEHKVCSYMRLLMDEVFGKDCFLNEIIWNYSGGRVGHNFFGRKHDNIYWYAKVYGNQTFNYDDVRQSYAQSTLARNKYKNNGSNERVLDYKPNEDGKFPEDVWTISIINPFAKERVDYPTQKPERLLEDVIKASTNAGDLVFDCFMGSGTTQAVAMKLGRRFIGADINLGSIQTTTKRLINVGNELNEQLQDKTIYTGFEVHNVNNYDFFRNPVEAKDLIIQALEIQPFPQSDVWDGELDGRMVKIMPVNRIATKADLEELKANLPYKTYEKRKAESPTQPVERITIVCMGHEPDLKASLEQELSEYKLDIEIVDILRDKKDLQLKREAEAEVVREGNKLVIRSFYPMNLMQKLSLQKEYVEDWRQLVESIMIDWNYDGVVMQPTVTNVPDKKGIVSGVYDIPENAGTIRVKITDLLSESLEVEVE